MNITVIEKVPCKLSNAKIFKAFQVEATSITCFLINWAYLFVIDKKTPIWYGNRTTYFDLKILGCLAYACVDNGNQNLGLSSMFSLVIKVV